jgi:EpsI family protein
MTINTESHNQPNKRTFPVKVISAFFLFGCVFLVLYLDTIIHIVGTWNSNEGAHGPLIVAVSLYLIWLKKNDFKDLPGYPVVSWGGLLAATGCFMLFAGKLSSTMLLQQVSMVPFLLGMILLLKGWSFFRALFLPVVYLIFITGFVETLLSNLAIYLQHASAWIAVQLFKLIGMPVILTGIIIDLPHISLEVVRACSGVSHLVAIMALSVPLGIMSKLPPERKVFLVMASFMIGLFANGFRIFLIGVYALYNEGADLHGPNETLAVSVIFFFGMILLVILNHFLRPTTKGQSEVQKEMEVAAEVAVPNVQIDKADVSSFRNAWIIAVMLIVVTLGFVQFYKVAPVTLKTPLAQLNANIGNFSGQPLHSVEERIRPFPADDELLRSYVAPEQRVDVYIGYFSQQSRERKLIDYRRGWMHEEEQPVFIEISEGSVTINHTRVRDRFNPSGIYFWYIMDDHIITSQYVGKFYTFWNGLIKRRTNGAVVVVETRSSQEEVMPFLKELVPLVRDFMEKGISISGEQ